jgi:hypothetical protein
MTDRYSREPNIVVSDISKREGSQRRGTCYDGKHGHQDEPAFQALSFPLFRQPTVGQSRGYSANSEYGVVGTWASMAFSSATIFGLRSQT